LQDGKKTYKWAIEKMDTYKGLRGGSSITKFGENQATQEKQLSRPKGKTALRKFAFKRLGSSKWETITKGCWGREYIRGGGKGLAGKIA